MPLLGILKLLVEAANRIDSDFRDNHPEIEWKEQRLSKSNPAAAVYFDSC